MAGKLARARARARMRLRARVEIGADWLRLTTPDGRARDLGLAGADITVEDATSAQRFVRHLHVACAAGVVDLITPPEEGSIAPRAAALPRAPDDAAVVEREVLDTLAEWLLGAGRIGGRTIEELARLVRLASPAFAVAIGERAGQIAVETTWQWGGPMRGGALGDDVRRRLRPLEEAAHDSERAGEALVAALAMSSRMGR